MQIVRPTRAWLLLALCAAAIGCSGDPATQVVTGRVALDEGAVAVRAVSGTSVVTAAEVRSDGSFTLVLPAGESYRLEVLTRSGALKRLVTGPTAALRDVTFRVCKPVAPYSVGSVDKCGDPNPGGCDPTNEPNCKCDATGNCCDPTNGDCPPPPPPCDPSKDPSCGCLPDGTCPPPPGCDPATDPNCKCDATGNCPPPPCDPSKDPNCGCLPDGTCPPPPGCTDPTDPNCKCDPSTGQNCGTTCDDPNTPGCLPPCPDPTDPNTCKDPCVDDPSTCGCNAGEPNCWPAPSPCNDDGTCKAGEGVTAEHPPGDFGCVVEDPAR